jgi:hypothetical protein
MKSVDFRWLIGLLVYAVSSDSFGQVKLSPQQPMNSSSAAQTPGKETFQMPLPKGWKQVGQYLQVNVRTLVYVPEGQTAEAWKERIRSQVYFFVKDAPPEQFLKLATAMPQDSCQELTLSPIETGKVNGFTSALVTRFCAKEKSSGQGEVTIFKLIQGKDSLYLGERSWRVNTFAQGKPPVPRETFAGWIDYMRFVVACESPDPKQGCPGSKPQGVPAQRTVPSTQPPPIKPQDKPPVSKPKPTNR